MRVVCRMGREILDLAALAVRPGVRCEEIDTIVHEACMERKCYPSPLNYRKFPKSVCTSVNEVRIQAKSNLDSGPCAVRSVEPQQDGASADVSDGSRLPRCGCTCACRCVALLSLGHLSRSTGRVRVERGRHLQP